MAHTHPRQNQAIGSPCNDLRGDADFGIGSYGLPEPAPASPGVGFRKLLSCILGWGSLPSVTTLPFEDAYTEAARTIDPSYVLCGAPSHVCTQPPPSNHPTPNH